MQSAAKHFQIFFNKKSPPRYYLTLEVLEDNISALLYKGVLSSDYDFYLEVPYEYRYVFKPYDVFYLSDNYTIDCNGLYTGKLIKKYPDSSKCVFNFKQGYITGLSKIYHKNGACLKKQIWNRHGYYRREYNINGQLIYLVKNYKKYYLEKKWFNNGRMASFKYHKPNRNNYSFGVIITTTSRSWNEEGNVEIFTQTTEKYNGCWYIKIGLQKSFNYRLKRYQRYIVKNKKVNFDLISGNGRFNFTSPYLKSTWRIRPKILIK
jgi:hypothetical protein